MTLDTDKMVDEALAMKMAVTGDAHGDYFHAFNWSDKPHRVVYDAAKIINAAAAELATLRAENERLRAALIQSVTAIDDWLNIYASDLCEDARVKEAKCRVFKYGTLAYISRVQEVNKDAMK